jgi:hypothetical protein
MLAHPDAPTRTLDPPLLARVGGTPPSSALLERANPGDRCTTTRLLSRRLLSRSTSDCTDAQIYFLD